MVTEQGMEVDLQSFFHEAFGHDGRCSNLLSSGWQGESGGSLELERRKLDELEGLRLGFKLHRCTRIGRACKGVCLRHRLV